MVEPDPSALRAVDAAHNATLREARELIRYHALRASNAARGGSPDMALAHASAAQALKDAMLFGDLDVG